MFGALSAVLLWGGILGIMIFVMSVNVSRMRMDAQVSLGDGGNKDLNRAIRIHGNAVESVPLALVLMLLMASAGYAAWLLHILGIALVIFRAAHAYGLLTETDKPNMGRAVGGLGTGVVIAIAGLLCIIGAF
jgi:hypothetical protein